ncbi:3-deoxy-7-phosphoheptulonate synthase [Auraticoccus monumenti]|uniref:Phospho-2-dehydro-3-deoxyheptonate aldolase n=1 Tax=Auraticoccus monumenti TaxID=675864 RepID=A0A1G7CR49_9ACTN|nr:3-deoxy-7-phosphoheptulonate synthase [Auraticoccus monumenti]SDE41713.1 3-deoxy-D-arabinoheptulosonate-7-phosphate synthase [Auraticoccus monumenti]
MTTPLRAGTADLRVTELSPLPAPDALLADLPVSPSGRAAVERGRSEVAAVLDGLDDRLLVVVGPCSIHDVTAGLEYADRLASLAGTLRDDLLVVMRTYFEKPRTTVGWKGLVNDPHLDGSHDIATGIATARRFLLEVGERGLPCATEFLEPITPQYLADLVSWGAIGARTAESQIHRQLVSGLSMPVGFKNGTDGDLQVAVDGCSAAAAPQSFLGIDPSGRAALVSTAGNPDTHLVLRGGRTGPNHGPEHVAAASTRMGAAGLNPRVLVDASHANSGKDHRRQAEVARSLAGQVASGSTALAGVMLESFLVEGAQPLDVTEPTSVLTYGQSVTDACMSWDTTVDVLTTLAAASRERSGRRQG